jgi:hypothetical protein
MGFDRGAVSYRVFYLPKKLPENAVDLFAQHAAPAVSSIGEEEVRGWVTGRHLLDRNITEETAYRGQYLFLSMVEAQRKVPRSLLQAECKMEELAVMAADIKPFVDKQQRAEIRQQVTERLLPNMPPQIKGTEMVAPPDSNHIFAAALPTKTCDTFTALFQQTLGYSLLPLTPDLAALERSSIDINQWNATSFTPDIPKEFMDITPGRDFLTWLWFYSEARGGVFDLPESPNVAVMLEGPLLFTLEGEGAYETMLRKGEPINSTEAKTCLLSGKKLKQAKITIAIGEEIWTLNFDADEFIIRNLKIPKIEEFLDSISHFEERMRRIERFTTIFLQIYDQFVVERSDSKTWSDLLKDSHKWIKNRIGRV